MSGINHIAGTTAVTSASPASLMGGPSSSQRADAAMAQAVRSPPSPNTQQAYLRDVARLLAGKAQIKCRRTSYRYRAAWVWFLQQHTGDSDIAPQLLQKIEAALEACPPGSDQFADNRGRVSMYQGAAGRGKSKRPALRKLPADWRDQMLESIDEADIFIAMCILVLTGLRPSELERGVVVLWMNQQVNIGIKGSKLRADRGQPWRSLSIDEGNRIARALVDVLELEPNAPAGFRYAKALLQRDCRGWAASCFPEICPRDLPSPLSFRHQFASDLKLAGASRQLVAAALGHGCERTSEIYGRKSQGRTGGGLVNASAARQIRSIRGFAHIVSVTQESSHEFAPSPAAIRKSSPSGPGGW